MMVTNKCTLIIVALFSVLMPGRTSQSLVELLRANTCQAEEKLFQAREVESGQAFIKEQSDFGRVIRDLGGGARVLQNLRGTDGATCDAEGNLLFLVYHHAKPAKISKLTPTGSVETLIDLPEGTGVVGLCHGKSGHLYTIDLTHAQILKINPHTKAITAIGHDDKMLRLCELTITQDESIYLTDVNYTRSIGQIWRIGTDGTPTRVAAGMGVVRAVEISPDGKLLYVCEKKQKNLWVFRIGEDGSLSHKRLVKEFAGGGMHGLKCDVDGNLYLTEDNSKIALKLSPKGEVLQEINVLRGSQSFSFGGSDGRTVYVLQGPKMVEFRADRPGLAWQRLQK